MKTLDTREISLSKWSLQGLHTRFPEKFPYLLQSAIPSPQQALKPDRRDPGKGRNRMLRWMAGRVSPGPPGIQSGLEVMTGTGRRKERRKTGLPVTSLAQAVSLGSSGREDPIGTGSNSQWFLENLSSPSLSTGRQKGPAQWTDEADQGNIKAHIQLPA